MSKRNINHKSGKQLYLNQIFQRGMLYTSSEMQEGYAKVIDNYDIAPTGDAASPRPPFNVPTMNLNLDYKYISPVKFKQLVGNQSYIRFKRTITEEDFVEDKIETPLENPGKTIDVVYRNDNAFNEGSLTLEQLDYLYAVKEGSDDSDIEEDPEIEELGNIVKVDLNFEGDSSDTLYVTISEDSNRSEKNSTITIPIEGQEIIVQKDTYTDKDKKYNTKCTFDLAANSINDIINDIKKLKGWQISLKIELDPSIFYGDACREKNSGKFKLDGGLTYDTVGTYSQDEINTFKNTLSAKVKDYCENYNYKNNMSTKLVSTNSNGMYLNIKDISTNSYVMSKEIPLESFEYKFKCFRYVTTSNSQAVFNLRDLSIRDWWFNRTVSSNKDPILHYDSTLSISMAGGSFTPQGLPKIDSLEEIAPYFEAIMTSANETYWNLPYSNESKGLRKTLKFPYIVTSKRFYPLPNEYPDEYSIFHDTSFLNDNISLADVVNNSSSTTFTDYDWNLKNFNFELEVICGGKDSTYDDAINSVKNWITQNQTSSNSTNTSSAFHFFTKVLSKNITVDLQCTISGKSYSLTDLFLAYVNKEENVANAIIEKVGEMHYDDNRYSESLMMSYHFSKEEYKNSPSSESKYSMAKDAQSNMMSIVSNYFKEKNYNKQTSSVSYDIIDGDTFKYQYNSESPIKTYRLWIADSVEKGFKWYTYSKNFLESTFKALQQSKTSQQNYLDIVHKSVSYGREVADFNLIVNLNTKTQLTETGTFDIAYPITDIKSVYYIEDPTNKQDYTSFPVSSLNYTAFINKNNINEGVVVDFLASCNIVENSSTTNIFTYPEILAEYSKYTNYTITGRCMKYPLLELFLKSGLYTMRSGVSSTEDAFKWSEDAEDNGYYRYWDETNFPKLMFTDPYYNPSNIVVEVDYNDDSLQITEDMYIEAVKLQSEHYISALTKTSLDYVNTIYIDYLDAIGFIGRIIDYKTNSIVYKGLITIKPDVNKDGTLYFKISLPRAQGEGYQPNVIESSSNGYNLYNKELFHVKNTSNKYEPFLIQGLAILRTDFKDDIPTINYDKPSLVTHGVVGQTVGLNALLNEGYWINTGLHNTDKWGYRINLRITANYIKDSEKVDSRTITFDITKSISNTSNVYYKNIDLTSSDYESTIEYDSITFYDITITDISLITPENETVAISLEDKELSKIVDKTKQYEVFNLISSDEGFFELKLKIAFNPSYDYAAFSAYDNFTSPSKTLSLNEKTQTIELVDRESAPQVVREFYSQWSVADYNSAVYEALQDEVLLYKSEGASLTKIENASEDLLWTINRVGNLTFKFSIKPKIRISDDPNHPLYNYFMTNSFEEQYQVYPKFEVDNNLEFISTGDITKNINIKNATKLDIFNRQIVLYGDYIGSNILQFSNFEEFDYYPFPYNTIELPEPIVYVKNYKDALIIFGKTSIYMLSGAASIRECTLNKIYENLSCRLPDIKNIQPIGNNLMFFNNGMGYIIVPNAYVDSSSNIKIYKLTEHISNFFYNPEEYIRLRLEEKNISVSDSLTYTISFDSYVENNTINVIANIEVYDSTTSQKYYLPTIFIYNQDYKYWKMYSTDVFDEITSKYICEPNLNTQFIVRKGDKYYLSYLSNTTQTTQDVFENTKKSIETILHSGYLSVDTMNDKRFKDIIIEFDKINPEDKLQINFEFFVDSSPIILSSENILVIDKLGNSLNNLGTEKILTEFINYSAQHISNDKPSDTTYSHKYGTLFEIDNRKFSITGRTHVRIPVFGKGRLPSFILKIKANKFYEFINYALIYKEKNINRRA